MFLPLIETPTFSDISINVNNQCNLRCTYCFIEKEPSFMDRKTARKIISAMKGPMVSKPATVHFFGTEPLLSFHLIRYIVEALGTDDFEYTITTNATLMNQRKAEWLALNKFNVLISCDGTAEATKQRVMNGSGKRAWYKIIEGWQTLVRAGVVPAIAATVTDRNLHLLTESAEFLLSQPQRYVHFNFDTMHSKWTARELTESWRKLAHWYYTQGRARGEVIKNFHDFETTYSKGRTKRQERVTCGACHGSIGFDWDGKIRPCHRTNLESVGDVHLPTIIDNQKVNELRNVDFNECHSCPANPCSTCYANFQETTGSPYTINREWCKVQLAHWQVHEELADTYKFVKD